MFMALPEVAVGAADAQAAAKTTAIARLETLVARFRRTLRLTATPPCWLQLSLGSCGAALPGPARRGAALGGAGSFPRSFNLRIIRHASGIQESGDVRVT